VTGGTTAAGAPAGVRWDPGSDVLCAVGGGTGFAGVDGLGAPPGGVFATDPLGVGALGCGGKLEDVGNPVGPVVFGKTTVGAEAAIVSSKSGGLLPEACSSGDPVGNPEFADP